jgi:hypothetical protein
MTWLQHFIGIHSVLKYAGMFSTVANMQEAIALVNRFQIKAEIIGFWLYCFTTPIIGFQLEYIGFWYSFKHDAYIYTGRPKEGTADDESLDEIRARLGSQKIRG